jgi:hypothetical protein
MAVLTTYHGVVEKEGIVRVREGALLPAGTEVIIVAAELALLEEQKRRLANIPASEWRQPFDVVRSAWDTSEPVPDEGDLPSDEELVALVRQARSNQ